MENICSYCKKNTYKYKCPYCLVLYCSIECFKNHNSECYEKYCEKQVKSHLKSLKPDAKQIKEMKQLLRKVREEDEIIDINSISAEEKQIKKLEKLGDNISINDLTEEEKVAFKGYINEIKHKGFCPEFPELIPWWTNACYNLDIEEIEEIEEIKEISANANSNESKKEEYLKINLNSLAEYDSYELEKLKENENLNINFIIKEEAERSEQQSIKDIKDGFHEKKRG